MRLTISGFWTALVVVIAMTVLLFLITKKAMVYRILNPNTVIILTILVILRILFPFEPEIAREISIRQVVPEFDAIIRYPLFWIGEYEVRVWMLFTYIWIGGAGYKFCMMICDYDAMKKYLYLCKSIDKRKISVIKKAERELGICRQISYKVSDEFSTPFIFGIWKPVIVFPGKAENFNEKELYMMLYHELSHCIWHDCLMKMILETFGCVFWWIPVIRPLMDKLDEAVEIRADWNATRKMSEDEKTQYLQALYYVAAATERNEILYANKFFSGQAGVIEKRLKFIISPPKWRFSNLLAVAGALLFLSSYLFVIEPMYSPEKGIPCQSSCEIYDRGNGEYKLYMDDCYVGIVNDLSFLNDPYFKKIKVSMKEDVLNEKKN